ATKAARVVLATMRARVVFPAPGGPQRIRDERRSASIALRRSVPSPITCSCPTSSSRLRGRMRVESGARDESCCNRFASNMSIGASGVALFGVEVTGFLFELLEQVDQLLAGGHADLVHGLEHFFQLVHASEEILQVGRVTAVPSPGSVQVNDVVWHEERLL